MYTSERLQNNQQELRKNPTKEELAFMQILRELGLTFIFQKIFKGLPYICDFYIKNYGVVFEVNGYFHYFQTRKDYRRAIWIEQTTGYMVYEIRNSDVLRKPEKVKERIKELIKCDK